MKEKSLQNTVKREVGRSQGMGVVISNWFDRVSLHVQTLMLTDVQTPFLGTPLAPLKHCGCVCQH